MVLKESQGPFARVICAQVRLVDDLVTLTIDGEPMIHIRVVPLNDEGSVAEEVIHNLPV